MVREYRLENITLVARELLEAAGAYLVWAIEGDMGAGKTTLIHALCNELKMEGSFGSPTFSLINEYAAPAGSIYHIDLYRCKNEEEAIRAGVEDCLYSGNRCFVEWPSRAPKIFPADAVHLFINVTGEDARNVEVTFPAGNQSQYKWRTHTKS
jgi:tRNA threonylcarbamoyladenosine biosynthesis protein TsaE